MSDPNILDDDQGFSDLYDMTKEVDRLRAEGGGQPGAIPPSQNPMLEAGGRGFMEGLGATGGLAAGVKMGLPFAGVPVVGPAIPVATGIGGMLVGSYATSQAAEAVGLRSPEQMPEDQRPRAVFGQNVGAGAGMLIPAYGLANTGIRFAERSVGKYLNSMLETVKRSPWLFGAAETTSSISAGLAGAGAEKLDSGNTGLRMVAEGAGGIANPVWRLNQFAQFSFNTAKTLTAKFGGTAQQDLIARQILGAMAEHGEDPATVIRILKQQMPDEINAALTAGQTSGSDILIGLEKSLYAHSAEFGNDASEKARAAMDMSRIQIGLLAQTGKPEHLAEIAKIRQSQYETLISDKLEQASTESVLAMAKLSKGGKLADKGVLSTEAKVILNQVEDDIGKVSSDLWSKVDRKAEVPITNTMRVRQELLDSSAKYLKGEKVPSYLENAVKAAEDARAGNFGYDPESFVIRGSTESPSITSVELLDYRRKLSSSAREAARAGDDYAARNLYKLEQAILQDLDTVFKSAGDTAYDEARGFTKAYHGVFERTFVGSVSAVNKTGDRIPPAMLLDRALAGGATAADTRLRDLESGSAFLETRGIGAPGATEAMLDTQEQFYRIVTAASIGKDGRVDPNQVRKYIEKNEVLLNRAPFTEIKKDLLDTIKSEEGLRRLEDIAKARNRDIGRESSFAQIVKSDPVNYATRILMDTGDQEKKLVSMFNLAKKGGKNISPDEGLRSARASVMSAAMNSSMNGTTLDLDKLRGFLMTPNVPGKKSVVQVMQEQGVVDADHVRNMRVMLDQLDRLNKAKRLGQAIDIETGAGEIGLILAAKIGASKVTSLAQGATGATGSELIVHGAVAKAVEQIVAKIPKAKTKDMAVLLFNDPKMLATVMERNLKRTPATEMVKARQLWAWALYSGLVIPALDQTRPESYEQQPEAPTLFSLPVQ
jgi:hypothetical protein